MVYENEIVTLENVIIIKNIGTREFDSILLKQPASIFTNKHYQRLSA